MTRQLPAADVEVWLPLGLLYAETGRDDMAAAAFAKAVASADFGLANDGELLQLIFVDSGEDAGCGECPETSGFGKKNGFRVPKSRMGEKRLA